MVGPWECYFSGMLVDAREVEWGIGSMVNVWNIFEAIMETMKDHEAWKSGNGNRKPCMRNIQGEERKQPGPG